MDYSYATQAPKSSGFKINSILYFAFIITGLLISISLKMIGADLEDQRDVDKYALRLKKYGNYGMIACVVMLVFNLKFS